MMILSGTGSGTGHFAVTKCNEVQPTMLCTFLKARFGCLTCSDKAMVLWMMLGGNNDWLLPGSGLHVSAIGLLNSLEEPCSASAFFKEQLQGFFCNIFTSRSAPKNDHLMSTHTFPKISHKSLCCYDN